MGTRPGDRYELVSPSAPWCASHLRTYFRCKMVQYQVIYPNYQVFGWLLRLGLRRAGDDITTGMYSIYDTIYIWWLQLDTRRGFVCV